MCLIEVVAAGHPVEVGAETGDAAYFRDLGFGLRIEEHDLHAEHLAAREAGRATFFVEGRRYYSVDLLSLDGRLIAHQYGHGETIEDALRRARKRFESEQRSRNASSGEAKIAAA
jgi:hypothetical protein